jgi:hypothetical protein
LKKIPMSAFREKRRARHEALKSRGIAATRRRFVVQVTLHAIPMPDWALARRVKGLSCSASRIWMKKRDGYFLARLDCEAGGVRDVVEAELRYCPVCKRPLLGEDAAARRRLEESGRTARQRPCGSECYEAQQDRRWKLPRTTTRTKVAA